MSLKIDAIIGIVCSVLFFSSCASRKNVLFNTPNDKNIPNVPVYVIEKGRDSLASKEQIIQPGDMLFIRNLQDDDLINGLNGSNSSYGSQQTQYGYRVENDSSVVLPVVGKVKLGGVKRTEAEQQLNKLYQSILLKSPIITLTITNLKVSLLGEFSKQGNYNLNKDQIHLVDIISEAGGFTNRANKREIKIIRGDRAHPQVISVNLEDIRSVANPLLYLQNNDIIYAKPKSIFNALDQLNPATSFLGIGLTLVNSFILIYTLSK
ncbi:polysaccharide biosynthesis/export family protein [Pedobacter sp. BS3]|uniref:polysaccharide biosynthesis/export family protein n=1 Tax=Pedobacter sp. BS3 TaxID=2567937 RepID=UPI001659BF04|nr:polysaccharide biosynthesis/export family protein [Pedobacter sp. BS3]